MSLSGHQRRFGHVRAMSAYRLIAGELQEIAVSRFGPVAVINWQGEVILGGMQFGANRSA
jgi:hypothetical protein